MIRADLPTIALSVRQPWAWAIIHAGKDIENRTVPAARYLTRRGLVAVHASRGMKRSEYDYAFLFMRRIGIRVPDPADLPRGGIVGAVRVIDVVRDSTSPWWMGPRGLVLADPQPCEFVPAAGALGYFAWKESGEAATPAAWMRRPVAEVAAPAHPVEGGLLL